MKRGRWKLTTGGAPRQGHDWLACTRPLQSQCLSWAACCGVRRAAALAPSGIPRGQPSKPACACADRLASAQALNVIPLLATCTPYRQIAILAEKFAPSMQWWVQGFGDGGKTSEPVQHNRTEFSLPVCLVVATSNTWRWSSAKTAASTARGRP